MKMQMIRSFEEFQNLGKEGFEAYVASANALTRGFQAIAQEAAEFSRRSFEKSTDAVERAVAAKSFDKVLEVQQGYAREAYESFVGAVGKFSEMYLATAREAYKPFEANFAALGLKTPPTQQ
jgi:hypothetical protein